MALAIYDPDALPASIRLIPFHEHYAADSTNTLCSVNDSSSSGTILNLTSHLIEFNSHTVLFLGPGHYFFVYTIIICLVTQKRRRETNILKRTKLAIWKSEKGGFGKKQKNKKQKFFSSHDTKLAKAQCLGVEQLSGFLFSTLDSCLIIAEDEVFSECVVSWYSFICVRIDCDISLFPLLENAVCDCCIL